MEKVKIIKSDDIFEDQKPSIIDKILSSYNNKLGTEKLLHHLQEALTAGALICLVCIENITIEESIWNCKNCYCSFHLHCIEKWARDSIFLQSQNYREDESNSLSPYSRKNATKDFNWSCPKCRSDYPSNRIPNEYYCFCRRKLSPRFDPWLLPHSCGEKCNKELKPSCGHSCLVLCHPGPCPPCPVMVRVTCYCEKATAQMRRCSSKGWTCSGVCGRALNCRTHCCQRKCHPGPCPTCQKTSDAKCLCGNSSQLRPCADLEWQCEKVCRRQLPCGHHKCERVCHEGSCGECPDSGQRFCPCQKMSFNSPCTEPVPTCGDTCSKPLSCGSHSCMERCHRGPCPSCLQMRVKKCGCGLREKELPCSKEFSCETKCKRIKDCKKHTCNRKCCRGNCPPCEMPCGKTLSCGHHKCQSRCHLTKCYPCSITVKLSCPCGGTSITVPCGMEKKAVAPKCNIVCKKKSSCHHTKRKPHKCHEGRCPPCDCVCGKKLPCDHDCPEVCHEAVPIKIVDRKKRSGPWEGRTSAHIEIQKLPCPPCKVPVPVTCDGKHETVNVPCSEWRLYSCGRRCGRALDCTHHQCDKECHVVEGAKDERSQGLNCLPCDKTCLKARLDGCTHPCKLPCHPGPCPCCEAKLKMKCHCGILFVFKDCQEWNSAPPDVQEKWRSCTNQCNRAISCGHRCRKQCHSGECSLPDDCREKVTVRCPCLRIRKSFPCKAMSGRPQVLCDDLCKLKLSEKDQSEETHNATQGEDESLRYGKGRKKRRREREQRTEGPPSKNWTRIVAVVSLIVLLLGILTHFLMK